MKMGTGMTKSENPDFSRVLQYLTVMEQINTNKTPRRGYIYVIIAALLWAISGSSSKFLFNSGVTPFQLVQLRLTISTVLLFMVLLVWRRDLMRIEKGDFFYFLFTFTTQIS